MKKRMRQLTTVNSTFIFKYTCTVCTCTCMCHEETHAQKRDMYQHTCTCTSAYNIITYMYVIQCCVQYTALDFTSCGFIYTKHVVRNMES